MLILKIYTDSHFNIYPGTGKKKDVFVGGDFVCTFALVRPFTLCYCTKRVKHLLSILPQEQKGPTTAQTIICCRFTSLSCIMVLQLSNPTLLHMYLSQYKAFGYLKNKIWTKTQNIVFPANFIKNVCR